MLKSDYQENFNTRHQLGNDVTIVYLIPGTQRKFELETLSDSVKRSKKILF